MMKRKNQGGVASVTFSVDESGGPRGKDFPPKPHAPEGVVLDEHEQTYLLPHFTMLVVGKPGSGKTTVVRELLCSKTFYKKKFDHVLLVSPSANKMEISVPKENMKQGLSLQWIEERLMAFNKTQAARLISRLRKLNIIDKFDVKRLNGALFDALATEPKPRGETNIFKDKERFFTSGLFKQADTLRHPGARRPASSS